MRGSEATTMVSATHLVAVDRAHATDAVALHQQAADGGVGAGAAPGGFEARAHGVGQRPAPADRSSPLGQVHGGRFERAQAGALRWGDTPHTAGPVAMLAPSMVSELK